MKRAHCVPTNLVVTPVRILELKMMPKSFPHANRTCNCDLICYHLICLRILYWIVCWKACIQIMGQRALLETFRGQRSCVQYFWRKKSQPLLWPTLVHNCRIPRWQISLNSRELRTHTMTNELLNLKISLFIVV